MNPQKMREWNIPLLIFAALTAIFFGWGAMDYVGEMLFMRGAEQVTGTVTRLSESTTYQDQQYWTDYCPVITFQTRAGQEVQYESQVCDNPPAYKIGQQIVVYYDPRNPKESQMQNWIDQYASVVGPFFLGGIFAFVGLLIFWGMLQKEREIRADKARWPHVSGQG